MSQSGISVSRVRAVAHLAVIVFLASLVGAVSGAAAWALFESLDRATEWRLAHTWLVWLLPVAAFVLGASYHHLGGAANRGTSIVVGESLPPSEGTEHDPVVPYRMAPMIFAATFIAQLTGASVGREGAALQIGGSLTSLLSRPLRLTPSDRRLLLVAAMAGSFGGAFGVPLAGAVFGLEVQQTGRLRYEGLAPAVAASVTADFVVESLGRHTPVIDVIDRLGVHVDWWTVLRLVVVGVVAGTAARVFITVLHSVKHALRDIVSWVPARPVIGAIATLALMLLFGRDYLGLSLPLIDGALNGAHADWWDPVLKIVFTAVALGCSIPGGEVTPLFVVGATLGSVLASPLGLSPQFTAAAGLAAVFGAASNTPVACAVLTVELFGAGMAVPAAVVCVVAFAVSPRHGIYEGQRAGATKDLRATATPPPHA